MLICTSLTLSVDTPLESSWYWTPGTRCLFLEMLFELQHRLDPLRVDFLHLKLLIDSFSSQ
jgi:hypothetical protein